MITAHNRLQSTLFVCASTKKIDCCLSAKNSSRAHSLTEGLSYLCGYTIHVPPTDTVFGHKGLLFVQMPYSLGVKIKTLPG